MSIELNEFEIVAIPADRAEALRRRGGKIYVADEVPGYPCRQCLCDAEIGEELILVSYDPFLADSPYRSASPIFLHHTDCGQPDGQGAVPLQLRRRQLSVRSFDTEEMMIDAAVIEGSDLADTITGFLAVEGAAMVHIHNATRGCWAATARRAR